MHRLPVLHDRALTHRWSRVPAEHPAAPVLVGVADADARIGITAALVAAGCRVVLARTSAQAEALLPTVDVIVADARLLGGVRVPSLRSTRVLLLARVGELLSDAPARIGATAIVHAPFDVDDIATIVLHLLR